MPLRISLLLVDLLRTLQAPSEGGLRQPFIVNARQPAFDPRSAGVVRNDVLWLLVLLLLVVAIGDDDGGGVVMMLMVMVMLVMVEDDIVNLVLFCVFSILF